MTVRSHELRRVRREQAAERRLTDEQKARIRERMEANRNRDQGRSAERVRHHNAVVTSLVPRMGATINGWAGKRVPFSVDYPATHFSAATDFETIRISIPEEEVTIDFAADLRGLAYHEAGHILKSIPFPVMVNEVMPCSEDYAPHARDAGIYRMLGLDQSLVHHAWNMLEDQRMESSMVQESMNLGRYYNVIVLTHVMARMTPNAYLLLYGRKHVDADVRKAAWAAFVQENGAAVCEEAEQIIDTYKASISLQEMWECTVRFARIVGNLRDDGGLGGVDDHEEGDWEEGIGDRDLSDSVTTDDTSDESPDGSNDSESDEEDEDDDDDDDDSGLSDVADRGAVGPGGDNERGANESIGERDWTRDLLREALEAAKEERRHDGHVVRDVRAFNDALSRARESMAITRIPALPDPDPAQTAEALKLNRSLRTLMDMARAQTAPSWQVGQSRGILDVRAYATRQPGDTSFYRNYAEGGDLRLPDMAVSVLLDGSGSMLGYAQELAVAAFGIKSACDVCNVPCTVMVYDTSAYLLWDHEDRPFEVPYDIVPNGGTDPKRALDLIDMQRYDKRNHLVIIMTDGAWGGRWHGEYSLAHYQAPDRDMVMFYYNTSPTQGPRGAETLSLAQRIDDLQEMPKYLRQYLLRAM